MENQVQTYETGTAMTSAQPASHEATPNITAVKDTNAMPVTSQTPSKVVSEGNPSKASVHEQAKPRYEMVLTNTEHVPRRCDQNELPDCLPAPASIHTSDALHSLKDVAEIATTFRCAMKWVFEECLRPRFRDLGGECRVYFKKVVDRDMGMHAYIKDIEVAHFPEWCIGHIFDDDGYIRTNRKGWSLIDQYGNSRETKGGIAKAREPFASCLHSIANAIYDINQTLCDEYESWLKSELDIADPDETLSTDQLYLAFENLMQKIPEMINRIKKFTE